MNINLSDVWEDKTDGVDFVEAEDINIIANAVIALQGKKPDASLSLDSSNSVQNKVITKKINDMQSDIDDKEDKANKTTVVNDLSTDNQYPTAKSVYDAIIDNAGDSISVDDTLSLVSENPVQNKVVTEMFDKKLDLSRANIMMESNQDPSSFEGWGINIIGNANTADIADTAENDGLGYNIADTYLRKDSVDDALDDNSTNPVQNKVITQKLMEIQKSSVHSPVEWFRWVENENDGISIMGFSDIWLGIEDEYKNYITIPSQINGKRVNVIEVAAFENRESLKSVFIPNGVTDIGDLAFNNCIRLTSISLPDSLNGIGWMAFVECTNLESVIIPYGVSALSDTFVGCTNLKSVVIPNSVTEFTTGIGAEDGIGVFANCESLKSITIPNGITSIEKYTFKGCTSLGTVVIPDSVIEIEAGTFGSGVTIYCSSGSYAEQYAIENGLEYEYSTIASDYVDNKIGKIETSLDNIIAIQNTLIGGSNV